MALFLCVNPTGDARVLTVDQALKLTNADGESRPQLPLFLRTANQGDVYVMTSKQFGEGDKIHLIRLGREFREKIG